MINDQCQKIGDHAQKAEAVGLHFDLDGNPFYQNSCVTSVSPEVAAREVVASMQLQGPSVGMTPRPGPDSVVLVGYDVWMWVDNPEIFGTVSAIATLGGTSIGVVGHVAWVDWDMGDGNVVRCAGPGTPYVLERDGLAASPDCGHVYTEQGEMTVTATAHWELDWFGGGQVGRLTDSTASTLPVTVGEWQVLLKKG